MRRSDPPRCSFCHKTEGTVGKLISSPRDDHRAYICHECVAVCVLTIEDDVADSQQSQPKSSEDTVHPLQIHPLASKLMGAIETWIRLEPQGKDALIALNEVRSVASQVVLGESCNADRIHSRPLPKLGRSKST